MSWNYRVLEESGFARLIEVYYDEFGYPTGWCEASLPWADGRNDLAGDLARMCEALGRDTLIREDLPCSGS